MDLKPAQLVSELRGIFVIFARNCQFELLFQPIGGVGSGYVFNFTTPASEKTQLAALCHLFFVFLLSKKPKNALDRFVDGPQG